MAIAWIIKTVAIDEQSVSIDRSLRSDENLEDMTKIQKISKNGFFNCCLSLFILRCFNDLGSRKDRFSRRVFHNHLIVLLS